MAKILKKAVAAICIVACAATAGASFAACSGGKGSSVQLGKPAQKATYAYTDYNDADYGAVIDGLQNFSAKFSAAAIKDGNFAVSPLSVYCALAMIAECSAGTTRSQVLDALGVSYDQLSAQFGKFYARLDDERYVEDSSGGKKLVSALKLTNSVWVNEGTRVKEECVSALSNKYYGFSYSAPFFMDNAAANKALTEFVKENTKGLIDRNFNLSDETEFALVNTLYLKDVWNFSGNDLKFTDNKYDFTGENGVKNLKLLQGYYLGGRAYESEKYTSFYTATSYGYKIKFMVPKSGYGLLDAFTEENIKEANTVEDYGEVEGNRRYHTRCLFPEFDADYDCDVKDIFKEKFSVKDLFSEQEADFSNAIDEKVFCGCIQHVTKLTVDKKGVEGAAVTVVGMGSANGPGEQMEDVYLDFIVDKSFGYIVTDCFNTPLFAGIIDKV